MTSLFRLRWAVLASCTTFMLSYTCQAAPRDPVGTHKAPSVVYLSNSEVVGVEDHTECYRVRLGMSVSSYGTGGDYLVAIGEGPDPDSKKSAIEIIDLREGKVVLRQTLKIFIPAQKEGIYKSCFIDPKDMKCYLSGIYLNGVGGSHYRMVEIGIRKGDVDYHDLSIGSTQTIALGEYLGLLTTSDLYRFSKPPFEQRSGLIMRGREIFDAEYVDSLGIIMVNLHEGRVTHLSDPSLRRLENQPSFLLSSKRLSRSLVGINKPKGVLCYATTSPTKENTLEAVDLLKMRLAWKTTLSGSYDQVFASGEDQVFLLSCEERQIKVYNPATKKLATYAKLNPKDAKEVLIVWAK